jgi:dihydrofolate reductase
MTRKLIIEEWLSLDGCVADHTGGLGFFAGNVRQSYTAGNRQAFLDSIDTILLGRSTYDQFSALWPGRPVENDLLAEKMNTARKIVFSGSITKAPWGGWPAASVEAGNAAARVKALQQQPGKNMVVWGSVSLAQAFMKENMADEYHLHLCPVLTGGKKLVAGDIQPTALALLETTPEANGVVLLRYGAVHP